MRLTSKRSLIFECKYLTIHSPICKHEVPGIVCLLESSPNLETLVVRIMPWQVRLSSGVLLHLFLFHLLCIKAQWFLQLNLRSSIYIQQIVQAGYFEAIDVHELVSTISSWCFLWYSAVCMTQSTFLTTRTLLMTSMADTWISFLHPSVVLIT